MSTVVDTLVPELSHSATQRELGLHTETDNSVDRTEGSVCRSRPVCHRSEIMTDRSGPMNRRSKIFLVSCPLRVVFPSLPRSTSSLRSLHSLLPPLPPSLRLRSFPRSPPSAPSLTPTWTDRSIGPVWSRSGPDRSVHGPVRSVAAQSQSGLPFKLDRTGLDRTDFVQP